MKKSPDVPEQMQNAEVNGQILKFMKLLSEVVASTGGGEIQVRLDRYVKMMDVDEAPTANGVGPSVPSKGPIQPAREDGPGPLVKCLLDVFDDGSEDIKGLVKVYRNMCSIEAAIADSQVSIRRRLSDR